MPLLFDMPRAQLDTYQGSTPRPADFDEYWAAGLAELAAGRLGGSAAPVSGQAAAGIGGRLHRYR